MVNESGKIEMDSFHGMGQNSCNWTLTAPTPGKMICRLASSLLPR